MKEIMMLSMNGCAYYFNNDLSEIEIKNIDSIATEMSKLKKIKGYSDKDMFNYFIKKVNDETGISLNVLTIKHIFRVSL